MNPFQLVRSSTDSARWTAWQRARESERSDALFHDALAHRFVGPTPPPADAVEPRVPVRTSLVDRLLRDRLERGVDMVIHLGAGFDTRPQRLALPPSLRWIEVDVEEVVEEKSRVLANDVAGCVVERVAADLADGAARARVLGSLGGPRTLVLTEGLLVYLEEDVVASLARELFDLEVGAWITDVASPVFVAAARAAAGPEAVLPALFRFAPAEGPMFFEALGWRVDGFLPLEREVERLGRVQPFPGLTGELRELLLDAAGVALLTPATRYQKELA